MLTKKDIALLRTVFITRDYFEEKIEELRKEITNFKSNIFDKLDTILKEIVASREEQTILSHKV